MKTWLRITTSFIQKRPVLSAVGALVVALIAWGAYSATREPVQETFVAARGEFVDLVSVSGTVVAAQSVDLGFAQSGRITGVYVRVGSRAGAGTLLAQIENGDLRAAVAQREAALETAEADLAEVEMGTRPEEIAVAEAQVAKDEAALLETIADAHAKAQAAVRTDVDQFIINPRTTPQLTFNTTNASVENSIETKRLTVETALTTWGTTARDARAHLVLVQSLLEDAATALNYAIPDNTVTASDIAGYSADISAARNTLNSAHSAITSATATLEASKLTLQLKQAGSTAAAIAAQAARVKAARADVQAAQAQLQKTLIVAPFSGTVSALPAKVGKIVSPNTPEVSMISTGTYQIESYVPEINIAKLEVGDIATVTLDAYGEEAAFEATIVAIDPAETVRDGVSTYRALLEFAKADQRIRAGMTANVSITTERKDNVLMLPQGLVLSRNGKKYVSVRVGESTEEREVTVGNISSTGDIEILGGIDEGAVLVLR